MNIRSALRYGNIEALDRELLLAFLLKRGRTFLLTHPEYELTEKEVKRFEKLVVRRENAEPLTYIVSEKEFFGLPFSVNRYTLIPRPETELLVEHALQVIEDRPSTIEKKKQMLSHYPRSSNINPRIAVIDVGTGSGCIIVSLIKSLQSSTIHHPASTSFFATDISKRALDVAKKNAQRHGVAQQITFVQSELLKKLDKPLQKFDEIIILANLPYLSEKLYFTTDSTVRNFEPKKALLSGQDGLDHYRELLAALHTLSPGRKVHFFLEISPEQAKIFPPLLASLGVTQTRILQDLSQRDRLVIGSWEPRQPTR